MTSSFIHNFNGILQSAIIIYIFMATTFYFVSDFIMFHPPRPSTYHDTRETLKILLPDGNKISAVYLPNAKAKYTILFSHGNAEDLGNLPSFLNAIHALGFSVMAYDYQGYGTSTGKPSEKNTYIDINAAYQYLTHTLSIPADRIIIFGRSLGTGPSIHLASLSPCAALILESPFVSAYRVQTIIPLFPFDKYPNLSTISKIKAPILIIQGTEDQVIPPWHGKKIFKAIKGEKEAFWVKGADHNNIIEIAQNKYWLAIDNFLHKLEKK